MTWVYLGCIRLPKRSASDRCTSPGLAGSRLSDEACSVPEFKLAYLENYGKLL